MRRLLILVLLLLAPGHAGAQESPIMCSPRRQATEGAQRGSGFMTLPSMVEHIRISAPSLKVNNVRQTALAIPTIELAVFRPEVIAELPAWRATWFEVVLHPTDTALNPRLMVRGNVLPPAAGDTQTSVIAEFPNLGGGWRSARWDAFILACVDSDFDPELRRENTREIRVFARQPVYVSSLKLSAALGIASVIALYLILAVASMQTQSRQLAFARAEAEKEGRRFSRLGFALNPTVIMQDAFGHCSLARFQVLLFTLVLTGVYAYVMLRTGRLPNLSPSVLGLLGITLAGSVLARVAEGPVVDTPNRLWLLGTGVLDQTPRLPRWRDLIAGDGEIDVTRVQALAFTLFAAAALVANGTGDLESFQIPDQLNYLMGISQTVYVAGKALPRETAKRLNDEIRSLRDAERAVLDAPADAAAQRAFETARNAVGSVLFDVFGERFNDEALRRLTPGLRRPPPPAVVV